MTVRIVSRLGDIFGGFMSAWTKASMSRLRIDTHAMNKKFNRYLTMGSLIE